MAQSPEELLLSIQQKGTAESQLLELQSAPKPVDAEAELLKLQSGPADAKGAEEQLLSLQDKERPVKKAVALLSAATPAPVRRVKDAFIDNVANTYNLSEQSHFARLMDTTVDGQIVPRRAGSISTLTGKPIEYRHTEESAKIAARNLAAQSTTAHIFVGNPQFEVVENELIEELGKRVNPLAAVAIAELAGMAATPLSYVGAKAIGSLGSAALTGVKRGGVRAATKQAALAGARGKVGKALLTKVHLTPSSLRLARMEAAARPLADKLGASVDFTFDPSKPRFTPGLPAKWTVDSVRVNPMTYEGLVAQATPAANKILRYTDFAREPVLQRHIPFVLKTSLRGGTGTVGKKTKMLKTKGWAKWTRVPPKLNPQQTSDLVRYKEALGYDWRQISLLTKRVVGKTAKQINGDDIVLVLGEMERMPTRVSRDKLLLHAKYTKKLSSTQVDTLAKRQFGKPLRDLVDVEFNKIAAIIDGVVAGHGKKTVLPRSGLLVADGIPVEPIRLTGMEKKLTPPFALRKVMPDEMVADLTQVMHTIETKQNTWFRVYDQLGRKLNKSLATSKLPKKAYLQKIARAKEMVRFTIKGGNPPPPVWTARENANWRLTQWLRSRGKESKYLIYPEEEAKARYIREFLDDAREPIRNMMRAAGLKPAGNDWIYDCPKVIDDLVKEAVKKLGKNNLPEELFSAHEYFVPGKTTVGYAQHRVAHSFQLENNIDVIMGKYVPALIKAMEINKVLPQAQKFVQQSLKGGKIDTDTANYIGRYIKTQVLGVPTETNKDAAQFVNKWLAKLGKRPVNVALPGQKPVLVDVERLRVSTNIKPRATSMVKKMIYWNAFAFNPYQLLENSTQRARTYSRMDLFGRGSLDALYGEMKAWHTVFSSRARQKAMDAGVISKFENAGELTVFGKTEKILDTIQMFGMTIGELGNRGGGAAALERFYARKYGLTGKALQKRVRTSVLEDQFMFLGEKAQWAAEGGFWFNMANTFMMYPMRVLEWAIKDAENLQKGMPKTWRAMKGVSPAKKMQVLFNDLNEEHTYRGIKQALLLVSVGTMAEKMFHISGWRAALPRFSLIKPMIDVAVLAQQGKFPEAKEKLADNLKFWSRIERYGRQLDKGWDEKVENTKTGKTEYPVYDRKFRLIGYAPDPLTWFHSVVFENKATPLYRRAEARREIYEERSELSRHERKLDLILRRDGLPAFYNYIEKNDLDYWSSERIYASLAQQYIPEDVRMLKRARKQSKPGVYDIQEKRKADQFESVLPQGEGED